MRSNPTGRLRTGGLGRAVLEVRIAREAAAAHADPVESAVGDDWERPRLTAPSVVRSERPTVSPAAPRTTAVSITRRVTTPGRQEHGERNEPGRSQPRLGDSHDDDEQREVVKPDEWAESERRSQRDDERAPLVTAPAEENDGYEKTDTERKPRDARERWPCAEVADEVVDRVRVGANRLLEPPEEIRVFGDPAETDGRPRKEQ